MGKTTPHDKFDPKKVEELQAQKANDRLEGDRDRSHGRDTRMSRDGGTNRRTRK